MKTNKQETTISSQANYITCLYDMLRNYLLIYDKLKLNELVYANKVKLDPVA